MAISGNQNSSSTSGRTTPAAKYPIASTSLVYSTIKMDWQNIINLAAGSVVAIVGWFVKGVKDEQRDHAEKLNEFRLEVAKDYVTHTDLADIKNTLFRIETKLDAKQDK